MHVKRSTFIFILLIISLCTPIFAYANNSTNCRDSIYSALQSSSWEVRAEAVNSIYNGLCFSKVLGSTPSKYDVKFKKLLIKTLENENTNYDHQMKSFYAKGKKDIRYMYYNKYYNNIICIVSNLNDSSALTALLFVEPPTPTAIVLGTHTLINCLKNGTDEERIAVARVLSDWANPCVNCETPEIHPKDYLKGEDREAVKYELMQAATKNQIQKIRLYAIRGLAGFSNSPEVLKLLEDLSKNTAIGNYATAAIQTIENRKLQNIIDDSNNTEKGYYENNSQSPIMCDGNDFDKQAQKP